MNKQEWCFKVETLAKAGGWMVYDSFHKRIEGFPDFVLVRHKIVFVAILNNDEEPNVEQLQWKESIEKAGVTWMAWRPRDLEKLEEYLE